MKILNNTENDILIRAKRMGYLIQESISADECYFIIDMNTNLVIAGVQDFLAWDEVVKWVVEADTGPTLN
jgi:hypothetical protein